RIVYDNPQPRAKVLEAAYDFWIRQIVGKNVDEHRRICGAFLKKLEQDFTLAVLRKDIPFPRKAALIGLRTRKAPGESVIEIGRHATLLATVVSLDPAALRAIRPPSPQSTSSHPLD